MISGIWAASTGAPTGGGGGVRLGPRRLGRRPFQSGRRRLRKRLGRGGQRAKRRIRWGGRRGGRRGRSRGGTGLRDQRTGQNARAGSRTRRGRGALRLQAALKQAGRLTLPTLRSPLGRSGQRRLQRRPIRNPVQRIGRDGHRADVKGRHGHPTPGDRLADEGFARGRLGRWIGNGLLIVGHVALIAGDLAGFVTPGLGSLGLQPIAGLEHPHDHPQAQGEEAQGGGHADPDRHVARAVEGPAKP